LTSISFPFPSIGNQQFKAISLGEYSPIAPLPLGHSHLSAEINKKIKFTNEIIKI
jgi:hypothetical protein